VREIIAKPLMVTVMVIFVSVPMVIVMGWVVLLKMAKLILYNIQAGVLIRPGNDYAECLIQCKLLAP
jgi:hypothetical protein